MVARAVSGAARLRPLVDRIGELRQAAGGRRVVLGIVGAPGAGKSTLARRLATRCRERLGPTALVGMDGFHLSNEVLQARGWRAVKGAPHTFDAAGYLDLLHRLGDPARPPVSAPEFRRAIEASIPDAVRVAPEVDVVLTEGNYLLLDEAPWSEVRAALTESWYLDLPDGRRRARLLARHRASGASADEAERRALGNDEANARLIAASRGRADQVVVLERGRWTLHPPG